MNKVPKLRFKEFNREWEEKSLNDITELIDGDRGKNYPNENDIKKEGILFLSTSNFFNNKLIFNKNDKFISLEKFNQLTKGQLNKDDLIITLRGSIGNVIIFENEFYDTAFINAQMMIIRPKNINKYFLHNFFQNSKIQSVLQNMSSGSAQPQLTKKDLKNFIIIFPILEEQEKISDFLSSVDKKISITEEKLELFKEYKKGIMQKIFNQKLRFKDSNGNDYPEWEEKEVGELLVESKILPEKQELEKRITVKLNLKGIEKRKITPEEKEGATTNYLRKEGQFIYGKQNFHKGAFGIIPKELDGYQSSSDIPSFDFIRNLIIGKYFYYYFSQKNVYENLENISTGTGSKRIQPKVFFNVKLDIPCLEEQQKIADFLSSIDNKIDNLTAKLEDLKEFKKGLLQQMFV